MKGGTWKKPDDQQARDVLKIEAESILELIDKIGDNLSGLSTSFTNPKAV